MGAAAFMVLALAAAPRSRNLRRPRPRRDAARDLIFLAENRPIFVRLRVTCRGRPFEASWIDSIRALHASLDRNGDGTLTTKEADPTVVAALVRLATGAADGCPSLAELDVHPKDGKVSIDELAEALRPILGPVPAPGRAAGDRPHRRALRSARPRQGRQLTRPELAAIAGSLRPLDLDDDEMISAVELEPFNSRGVHRPGGGIVRAPRPRFNAFPPVVELVAGESSFRPARLLLKKYDKGKGDVPGRPDGKLSPAEFAIDPDAFAECRHKRRRRARHGRAAKAPRPAADRPDARRRPSRPRLPAKRRSGWQPAERCRREAQVRRLADGDVEFAIGQVRLDIHVDDGNTAAEEARRILQQQFKAADANKDGYLEGKEQAAINAPQSPLAGLSEVIDRDGDGKIYLKELLAFADRQIEAAQARLVVTTDDQGRAIFGIVDLDRDRRLGAREVMRTVDRVMSWDGDGDGRVSADEIPYHFQVTIARGGLSGLTGEGVAASAPRAMAATAAPGSAAGPDWFQKMDRNHDGDVSRREFLGPRDQFDRLDRDNDGLIDADEARAAKETKNK